MQTVTVREMAAECRCCEQTIRRALCAGEMPRFRFGRGYQVRRRDFDSWKKGCMVAPGVDGRLLGSAHPDVKQYVREK